MDIEIELLQLNIEDASGHEHRIRPIASRAAEILAQRLEERQSPGGGRGLSRVAGVNAGTVNLDLNRMGDERAALSIANAWMEALKTKLETGG
jgi:hypothetical protein